MRKFLVFLILLMPMVASAQFTVPQGGTGKTSFTASNLIYMSSSPLRFSDVATGTISATSPLVFSSNPIIIGPNVTISCPTCGSGGGAATSSFAASWPITLTTSASAITYGFNGLSTSTDAVIGNIPYFSGANTFANVATGTVSSSGGITTTAGRAVIGGALAIGCTVATASAAGCLAAADFNTFNNKVATSAVPVIGNLAMWTGAFPATIGNVATGTLSATGPITVTAGNSVIGSGATIACATCDVFGKAWEIITNAFSVLALAPTTTVPIAIQSTASSTFAGGLEAWRQIAAPYFQATSTASSTFLGGVQAATFDGKSATASSTFANGIKLTGGCFQDGGGCITHSGGGTVTQVDTTFPIQGGPITTTGTLTFGGLATTAPFTIGQITYVSDSNHITSTATGTVAAGAGISVTAGQSIIGSGLTVTNTGVTSLAANSPVTVSGSTGSVTISCAICSTFGKAWELITDVFGQSALAPTTTVPIAVQGTGTSSFAGSVEAWSKIASPFFIATSTTATSTFQGLINVNNSNSTSTFAGNVRIIKNLQVDGNFFAPATITSSGNATINGALTVTGQTTLATSLTGLGLLTSGVVSAYGGTSCTNQFIRSLNGSGVATCASVSLSADVTGTLGVANGGTGATNIGKLQLLATDSSGNVISTSTPTAATFYATSTSASSTFQGLQATYLNLTGASTATSTSAHGFNLAGGCFAIGGTCIGSGGGSGTINSGTTGQFPYYAANGTTLTATSTWFLNTTGNLIGTGGIATSTGGDTNKSYLARLGAIFSTSTPSIVNKPVAVVFTGARDSAPSFSGTTLTLPLNTTYFTVEINGGGGGGGSNSTSCGSGGGGGGYAKKLYTNIATQYYYDIGKGGAAVTNGANTAFGTGSATTTANGGVAGGSDSGAGGTGGGATNGDINLIGQGGAVGQAISSGGNGGSSPRGGGGAAGPTGAGIAGNAFGGGGSGAGTGTGGAGGTGGIVITVYTW